jgi:ElaB/YqjD/DUF883 family membrane-anchored ribosome-binding protein
LNTKYVVNIHRELIKLLLTNDANILLHNNEKISPLVMLMKNHNSYYFKQIRRLFDLRSYEYDNEYSPYNYLMRTYKLHLEQYNKKFGYTQYNEIVQIIQANEKYYNNILKDLHTSFHVVKYITEQYLTENMKKYYNKFLKKHQIDIFELLDYNLNKIPNNTVSNLNYYNIVDGINKELNYVISNLNYLNNITRRTHQQNKELEELKLKLQSLQLPNINIIILNSFIKSLRDNLKKLIELKEKYILQQKSDKDLEKLKKKIDIINDKIKDYYSLLENYLATRSKSLHENNDNYIKNYPNIIERYTNLVNGILNDDYVAYMNGWNNVYDYKIEDNFERVPYNLIQWQMKNMLGDINITFKSNIKKIRKFYELNNYIIKDYFEKPRYLNSEDNEFNINDTLNFVNMLLKHLTKTFICSNIEIIIKKILYEYLSTVNIPSKILLDQVDSIFNDELKNYLYKEVPELFVRNGAGIYKDEEDEVSANIITVAEILNNLLDLLKSSSSIDIDDYTINLIKNNIITYFDTIVYKIINNWNVLIENIFIYHINHYRILDCFHKIL